MADSNSTTSTSEVVVQESDFDVAAEYSALCNTAPRSGAVVFFVGLVRDLYESKSDEDKPDEGKPGEGKPGEGKPVEGKPVEGEIDYIELKHYAGMTESLCQQIVDEARQKHPFDAARVIHRVGKLYAGDQIVMVAVASRHREAAFAAAQYIMDYLKTRATLWKKEVGARGEQWIGLKEKDAHAAQRW